MAKPKAFGVLHNGEKTDLLASLQERKIKGREQKEAVVSWQSIYKIKQPGDYTFFVEPEPYWEAAEDSYIIHYTKVCVQAFGMEKGWDEPVGLKTEIIPLSRPYGLWRGNVFTGKVLSHGQPLAAAKVEVEYLNNQTDGVVIAPTDAYVTQVVKTDGQGIFTYAMPRAGWWGFAALSADDKKIKRDGVDKAVEIGAVYWVHTTDMR
jgi:cobalt/nickel transport protein